MSVSVDCGEGKCGVCSSWGRSHYLMPQLNDGERFPCACPCHRKPARGNMPTLEPEQGDVAVIREALNSTPLPRRDPADPGWSHREDALAALDRLAAALERAEREREWDRHEHTGACKYRHNEECRGEGRAYRLARELKTTDQRAKKAERALAEMREALDWIGQRQWHECANVHGRECSGVRDVSLLAIETKPRLDSLLAYIKQLERQNSLGSAQEDQK